MAPPFSYKVYFIKTLSPTENEVPLNIERQSRITFKCKIVNQAKLGWLTW